MNTLTLSDLCNEDIAFTGIHAGSFSWQKGYTTIYRDTGRSDNMLFYVLDGSRRYRFPDGAEELVVTSGDLMLMPAASCYESVVLSERGSSGICLQFTLLDASGGYVRLGERPVVLRHESETPVHALMEEIHALCLQSGSRLQVKRQFMRLLMLLCESPSLNGYAELQPAVRYLETHLEGPVPLHQAASLCHMSACSFSRRFRAALGDSPAAWHRRLRLRKSRELLESGLYTVEQVALTLGFYDSAHFCHAYTAQYGHSPAQSRGALSGNGV